MSRVNKTIEGVFTGIVGDSSRISAYDSFINLETKTANKELKTFVNNYKKLIDKNKADFEKLAAMEEIIMQMRTKENITDIKISVVRDYIYARCPFYRKDKTAKDVRIIIDHLELYKDKLKDIETNPDLIKKAKDKLSAVMENEINENLLNFREKYKTIK